MKKVPINENLKKIEERRLGLPLEQENSEQEKKD